MTNTTHPETLLEALKTAQEHRDWCAKYSKDGEKDMGRLIGADEILCTLKPAIEAAMVTPTPKASTQKSPEYVVHCKAQSGFVLLPDIDGKAALVRDAGGMTRLEDRPKPDVIYQAKYDIPLSRDVIKALCSAGCLKGGA